MSHSLTYNDMLGAYAPYPAPIRPFLLRAETHPQLVPLLTKSFMRVFIDLLARAPIKDPIRPVKLSIDVISEKLGISTRTVNRAINFFKLQGWLNQHGKYEDRTNSGKFRSKEYLLGIELRHLLGLPVEPLAPPEQENSSVDNVQSSRLNSSIPAGNSVSETEMSHGVYIDVNKVFKKEASFQEEASQLKSQQTNPPNQPDTNLKSNISQQSKSTKQPTLPAELAEMAEILAINPVGICSLMLLAKQHNQLLQDVWRVKRDQLLSAGATEGRAFRYLQFLLNTGEDFAFRARNLMAGESKPTGSTTRSVKMDIDVRHYWNKKYIGEKGLRVHVHGDGSAKIYAATDRPSYVCPRDMPPIYEAIQHKKLRLIEE